MEQKNWKELLQKYKNYIIVLVILLVAIVTLARSCGQNKTENNTENTQQNQTEQTDPSVQEGQTEEAEEEEEPNELEENTHSSVERLVSKYLDCIVSGDSDALSEIVDDLSDNDKEEVQKLSKAYEAYGQKEIQERHRHRYEFNSKYREDFEKAGMITTGINPESGLTEIVEIPTHKWFVGVQFHPEYKSTVIKPHPLFVSFIKACLS